MRRSTNLQMRVDVDREAGGPPVGHRRMVHRHATTWRSLWRIGGIKWARYDGTTSTDGFLTVNGLREVALAEWPGLGNAGGNINLQFSPSQLGALRRFIREKVLISEGVTRTRNAGVWLSRSQAGSRCWRAPQRPLAPRPPTPLKSAPMDDGRRPVPASHARVGDSSPHRPFPGPAPLVGPATPIGQMDPCLGAISAELCSSPPGEGGAGSDS